MNVVPATYLALVRARKSMEKAFQNADWRMVQECDELLSELLNRAFDDPQREHDLLAKELENVLALYSTVMSVFPEEEFRTDRKPECVV